MVAGWVQRRLLCLWELLVGYIRLPSHTCIMFSYKRVHSPLISHWAVVDGCTKHGASKTGTSQECGSWYPAALLKTDVWYLEEELVPISIRVPFYVSLQAYKL